MNKALSIHSNLKNDETLFRINKTKKLKTISLKKLKKEKQ